LAKAFQSLRIEVNGEMDALREMLVAATDALQAGGRLVVIAYHSLEDRLVKNLMRTGNTEGLRHEDFFGKIEVPYRLITSKAIVPNADEIEKNPRARSAKLRIAEKKNTDTTKKNQYGTKKPTSNRPS
jgi:16S rRNA (cytosine1402-N4)-methyltransferase